MEKQNKVTKWTRQKPIHSYTYIWYLRKINVHWNYRTVSNFSVDSMKCELLDSKTLNSNYIEGNTITLSSAFIQWCWLQRHCHCRLLFVLLSFQFQFYSGVCVFFLAFDSVLFHFIFLNERFMCLWYSIHLHLTLNQIVVHSIHGCFNQCRHVTTKMEWIISANCIALHFET